MYKSIAILLLTCFLSCTGKHPAGKKDFILGNWAEVSNNFQLISNGRRVPTPNLVKQGFVFRDDSTYENKLGYFYDDTSKNWLTYLGDTGKYQVKGDSLFLYSQDKEQRERFKLVSVNADSLRLEQDSVITTFKHYQTKLIAPAFDKIILSTSGCYGTCATLDIMISADGKVLFNGGSYAGIKGWHSGSIPVALYKQLQNGFRQIDFDSLKTAYRSDWTDQQTVYVTFMKDNRIYRSVLDYGHSAPYLFEWACRPLQYLYQGIKLSGELKPDSIPPFEILAHFGNKKAPIIRLKNSEQFLLTDYLQHGKKLTGFSFTPRFLLVDDYENGDIKTDGRYYEFSLNGKAVTIDIGFNFFDVNKQNWTWEKPDDYGY